MQGNEQTGCTDIMEVQAVTEPGLQRFDATLFAGDLLKQLDDFGIA